MISMFEVRTLLPQSKVDQGMVTATAPGTVGSEAH